ncbi:Asparagine synthetase [glutamine-hydrolyzing] 1 [compost metagenome]
MLRRVLHRYVPPELVNRPKAGFAMPVADWLRHELRDWAETLLDERRLAREGILDPAPIRRRWREHLDGRRNWQASLWAVLMFQSWKERWLA